MMMDDVVGGGWAGGVTLMLQEDLFQVICDRDLRC